MRIALAAGEPVSAASNGKQARIVAVAFFEQDVERPLAAADDREAWRSVADDGNAGLVLEDRLGCPNRFTELNRSELRDSLGSPSMRCDLVARCDEVSNELRFAFRDPSEREERPTHRKLPEQLEQSAC